MTAAAFWVAIAAAALTCVFTTLQMALRTASRSKLARSARTEAAEQRVGEIMRRRREYAVAASVPRVLATLLLIAAVFVWMLEVETEQGAEWGPALGAAAISAALIYLAGVVLPMSIAEHVGEPLIVRSVAALRVLRFLAAPFVALASFVDEVVRRLAGAHERDGEDELEEEIRSVVSEHERGGAIDPAGRSMIEAVVDFRDATVQEIMTPRTEIEGIEATDDLTAIRDFIHEAGHSRIPVYEDNLDNVIGLLYAKDLLSYLNADPHRFRIRECLREAPFVPETKRIDELLREFQGNKVHLAIVLDEYGGTAGLVTIEDILEEIVGEIHDEYEPETDTPPEIRVDGAARTAEAEGRAYIDDVNDALEPLGAELPEGEEYDTVGGYVLSALGHIPVAGESFRHNGFVVTVLEAEPTKVSRVRIEVRPPEPGDDDSRPVPVEPPVEPRVEPAAEPPADARTAPDAPAPPRAD